MNNQTSSSTRATARKSFELSLSHAYLETARSTQQDLLVCLNQEVSPEGHVKADEEAAVLVSFALASMAVLYSVLAVESFINYQLYQLWSESRDCHKACEDLQKANPGLRVAPTLNEFYEKYGTVEEFEQLKEKREIRELGERIKLVCKYLNVRPIHEANPKLWEKLLALLQGQRHFLVHPYPDPSAVQKRLTHILTREPLETHPSTATAVIRHFYEERGQCPPAWLEKNTSFRFTGLEFPICGEVRSENS